MKKIIVIIGVLFLTISGCEDTDRAKIANAQLCIDKVSETDYPAIQSCVDILTGLDTQEANIVRCSGQTLFNGLTAAKILNAFKATTVTGGSPQGALMMTLAVTRAGINKAARAQEALNSCEKSGVSGLIAIASFSNIGTSITEQVGSCTNPDNCTPTEAAAAIGTCASNCSPSTVGSTAIVLAGSFCTGDNAVSDECVVILSAVSAGGGDPTAIGLALTAGL